jgi:redox-sensitive bicupin YhaK (pirin superfamily)
MAPAGNDGIVRAIRPLGQGQASATAVPWETADPFLFCVHHLDAYPAGNADLGPASSLEGRDVGQDFAGRDGWRMYHGEAVPGFPAHPHRGFETVTFVRRGFIDHTDSLGAAARYGEGDVQWLTAGNGIVHAEMFPLLERERANPLELFQIWLNLPAVAKASPPFFSMFWKEEIPVVSVGDGKVTVIAGPLAVEGRPAVVPPAAPPHSWAQRRESELAIWVLELPPHGRSVLPAASAAAGRTLYLFGGALAVAGERVDAPHALHVRADVPLALENAGRSVAEVLLLQGRPIGERVAQYGPFVMNEPAEIEQAFADYRRTQFGGWPWPSQEPVHPVAAGRFARLPDGRELRPPRAP